jgi:hypothetical protein
MSDTGQNKRHGATAVKLAVVVVAMFGFGYALVPLYDVICDITGLNGKTGQVTSSASARPTSPGWPRSTSTRPDRRSPSTGVVYCHGLVLSVGDRPSDRSLLPGVRPVPSWERRPEPFGQ